MHIQLRLELYNVEFYRRLLLFVSRLQCRGPLCRLEHACYIPFITCYNPFITLQYCMRSEMLKRIPNNILDEFYSRDTKH